MDIVCSLKDRRFLVGMEITEDYIEDWYIPLSPTVKKLRACRNAELPRLESVSEVSDPQLDALAPCQS